MRWRQGKRVLLVRTWQKFGGSGRQEGAGSYPLPHPTLASGHFSRHLCHHWAKTRRTTSSQADQTKRWQGTRIADHIKSTNQSSRGGGFINIPLCVMTSPTQLYTGTLLRTSKCINSNQVRPSLGCRLCIDLINIHHSRRLCSLSTSNISCLHWLPSTGD